MFRFVVLAALVAVTCGQYNSGQYNKGQDAAILSEARYLSGDGKFGAAYVQEDGVEFKEESDGDGNRRGTYSYVDPSGQRRTVSYTAGKEGFRATGDHLPVAPPAPAHAAPQPHYQPQPQYQPPAQQYNAGPSSAQSDYDPHYHYYQYQQNEQANAAPQAPRYNSIPNTFSHQPQPQAQPQPYYQPQPTEPPRNFHPPGKLSLSRTNDGFSYTFNKS